jgi:GNAT superfamily N-acetyltransferase
MLRLSTEGFKDTMKELFYFNREMILVRKDLNTWEPGEIDQSVNYTIVHKDNSQEIEKKFNLQLFDHYAQINCKTLLCSKDDTCIGFIRWTQDKTFKDLQKLEINLEPNQAYMFDFFLFPAYRGTPVGRDISFYAIQHLKSLGIAKYYGYFFADNFPALWWHRTICRTEEYKKIKAHKFILLEMVNGNVYV